MQFSVLDYAVIIAYLIGIESVGLYYARRVKNSGDFFVGGRKFSKFLMMMHNLGTGTHADDPVVVVGASFQRGLSGIWYTFVYLFLSPFYWIIAPYFRRSRYLTTSDFFESRFSPKLALLYTTVGVIVFMINIGTMLKGTGAIAQAATNGQVAEWQAILVMTVVFLIYGVAGGLIATVATEAVQGFLIVVMSLMLVPFGLAAVGGFSGLHGLLDSSKFDLSAPVELSLWWIVAGTVANLIGWVAHPCQMETCSTGKTEWEARIGATYGSFIKRFCAIGWALTGMVVLAMVANGSLGPLAHREEAFGTAMRVLLPPGLKGLMVAAILAAQMSTLSAFMVAGSALVSRNIYKRWLRPDASDTKVLAVARYSGLLIVGLGVAFAFVVPGVADALTIFWAVGTFTGLFIWFGVLWRKTNALGAWISFATMVPIWLLLGPVGIKLQQVLPAFGWLGMYGDKADLPMLLVSYLPAGIVALVVGSLLGTPLEKRKLEDFYMLLRTPVGQEAKLAEAGVKVVYEGETKGHHWETIYFRRVHIVGFLIAMSISFSFFGLLWIISRVGS